MRCMGCSLGSNSYFSPHSRISFHRYSSAVSPPRIAVSCYSVNATRTMRANFCRYFFTHWPALQFVPLAQEPQFNVPPQPSLAAPQTKPSWAHVLGVQALTHLPAVQLIPLGQAPHIIEPPQPSLIGPPHCAPTSTQVLGVQVWAARGGAKASIRSAIAVEFRRMADHPMTLDTPEAPLASPQPTSRPPWSGVS